MSTGSLKLKKPCTFPYASTVPFFVNVRLGTYLPALKGDILQNNLHWALKVTSFQIIDNSTAGQWHYQSCREKKITSVNYLSEFLSSCSALLTIFVQIKEYGKEKERKKKTRGWNQLHSLHRMIFLQFWYKEGGICQQSSTIPSLRVTSCNLLHFGRISPFECILSFLGFKYQHLHWRWANTRISEEVKCWHFKISLCAN